VFKTQGHFHGDYTNCESAKIVQNS